MKFRAAVDVDGIPAILELIDTTANQTDFFLRIDTDTNRVRIHYLTSNHVVVRSLSEREGLLGIYKIVNKYIYINKSYELSKRTHKLEERIANSKELINLIMTIGALGR